jgi:hypothetical protein
MSDQAPRPEEAHEPKRQPEDSPLSVAIGFVITVAATLAVLFKSGTIYLPGYH